MSNGPIRPSTIDGIKRFAKTLKVGRGLPHARALDAAAVAGGFQNFMHARRALAAPAPTLAKPMAYISVMWRVWATTEAGQEILAVPLDSHLTALVKPNHLKAARHLGAFRLAASDHLAHDLVASSQSDARRRACAAARTLAFMQATGLRPSSGHSRAYPRGEFRNAMPGKDHYSEWFDPATKAYVFVDEPYRRAVEDIAAERLAWVEAHGWNIGRTTWAGMYNPDGGCELYLAADRAKGFDIDKAVRALDALPPPFVEADWDGQSVPMFPPFFSPAAEATAAAPKPRAPRSPKASVGYRTALMRTERRRPSHRMPVDGHIEVGRLLKSVIRDVSDRKRVYKPLNGVRCDLDDWVQCEYDRTELPDEVFFNPYYHEDDLPAETLTGAARTERHIASLTEAKRILARHYPECAPLRAMLKAIDKASAAL